MKYTLALGLAILLVLTSCSSKEKNLEDNTLASNTEENMATENTGTGTELKGSVVLDVNHPLAGKTLNFAVELMGLEKAEGNTAADTAEAGDLVKVHYEGTLEDGTVFDASRPREQTLDFTLGAGQMIAGFDTGVAGMKVGDKKALVLPPEEAYGAYDETRRQTVPMSELESFINAGFEMKVGEKLPTQMGELEILEVIEE